MLISRRSRYCRNRRIRRCSVFLALDLSCSLISQAISLLPQYVWATASGGLLYRRPDEVYNLFERGSGLEYSRDTQLLELGGVLVWNYTSDGDQDVVHALFAQQLHDAGHDRIMGSGEDGQSDDLDVLLQGSVYDHFRGLAKASVNDLHAGVAERTRDHFG